MSLEQSPHLLVVDDDTRIRQLLQKFLVKHGFFVTTAQSAKQARSLLSGLQFDLIILDVMMPQEDGISLCHSLRRSSTVPIFLLTAKSETQDRILGLEAGADDYLSKPFEPEELLLRISAILRRILPHYTPESPPLTPKDLPHKATIMMGNVVYNIAQGLLTTHKNSVKGDIIRLTSTENQLLQIFSRNLNTTLSRTDISGRLSHSGHEIQERAIDVQITRLRKKIEVDPKHAQYLQTIRGEGYKLRLDE